MAKPAAPAPPEPTIAAPFIGLTWDVKPPQPIELNAFAIVSVEAFGTGSVLITAAGDPGKSARFVLEQPDAVKRAIRIAIRRMMAPPAAAPKPAQAAPRKSVAEKLLELHEELTNG